VTDTNVGSKMILRSENMTAESVFCTIFFGMLFYVVVFCIISEKWGDVFCFNLKENYKRWHKLNWFGVWFITILYWIAFLPFTIIALIYWLFTVGRKPQ
jgi:hypothetical protein